MSSVHRTLTATKQLVRKELKSKLKQMTDDEKAKQSGIIMNRLFLLDVYKKSRSISIYLSMPSEVYTNTILANVFNTNKKCYIPHYVGDNMSMVLLKDQTDYDSLPLTSWNIKQPSNDEKRESALEEEGLDLIIVPGLGFSKDGLRLGRGKGYYDTYFRKYESLFGKMPVTIGLAYSCQVLDKVPADEYDVKLDYVLYP